MTVSTTSVKSIGIGNGATTIWSYNFLINLAGDVLVMYTDAAGVNTTIGSSLYSITGLGNPAGGTVTYPLSGPAIANGTKLTIARNAPDTQLTDLVSQGSFSPDVVETGLDNIVLELQQSTERGLRSIRAPITDVAPVMLLPSALQRAGLFVSFDTSGNIMVTAGIPGPTGPSGSDDGNPNVMVNPDAAVAALGQGGASSVNDNVYPTDGLRILSEANGDTIWGQNAPSFFSGFWSADQIQINSANKKFGILKPVEIRDLGPFLPAGTAIIASAWMSMSASIANVKMAVLAWNGTADAISGDPISAWNADGVIPTLAAGWSYCNTPINLNVTHSGLLRYSVTGVVPSGTNNLALFIWNDGKTTTASQSWFSTQYMLQLGGTLLPFQPVDIARNLVRCQRYAPVFDAALGANSIECQAYANTATTFRAILQQMVSTRIPVTGVTVSNPTNFRVTRQTGATIAVTAITFASAGTDHITLTGTVGAGLTAGESLTLQSNNVNCRVEGTGARL